MKLSKKQSRAIAVLKKKQQKCFAAIRDYEDFREGTPNIFDITLLEIAETYHDLQSASLEAQLRLTQLDCWIRLIKESEDNIGEIILEILST